MLQNWFNLTKGERSKCCLYYFEGKLVGWQKQLLLMNLLRDEVPPYVVLHKGRIVAFYGTPKMSFYYFQSNRLKVAHYLLTQWLTLLLWWCLDMFFFLKVSVLNTVDTSHEDMIVSELLCHIYLTLLCLIISICG